MVLIWRDRAERVLRKRERELLRQLEGTNGLPPFGFGLVLFCLVPNGTWILGSCLSILLDHKVENCQ